MTVPELTDGVNLTIIVEPKPLGLSWDDNSISVELDHDEVPQVLQIGPIELIDGVFIVNIRHEDVVLLVTVNEEKKA